MKEANNFHEAHGRKAHQSRGNFVAACFQQEGSREDGICLFFKWLGIVQSDTSGGVHGSLGAP